MNGSDLQKLNDLSYWYSSQLSQLKIMKKHVSSKNKVVKKLKKMKGGADGDDWEGKDPEPVLEKLPPTRAESKRIAEILSGKVPEPEPLPPPIEEVRKPGRIQPSAAVLNFLMGKPSVAKSQMPREPSKFSISEDVPMAQMAPPMTIPIRPQSMAQKVDNLHYNINMIIDVGPKFEKLLQEKINILNEKINKIHSLI